VCVLFQDYRIPSGAACLAFSGRGFLAAGLGGGDGIVEIYKDACTTTQEQAYMRHRVCARLSIFFDVCNNRASFRFTVPYPLSHSHPTKTCSESATLAASPAS
jgi:hypothetical protein